MADVFDVTPSDWTYSAAPSALLYGTQLPLPPNNASSGIPKPRHDAACWARVTKGMDFSKEDLVDDEQYAHVLWKGIMEQALSAGIHRSIRSIRMARWPARIAAGYGGTVNEAEAELWLLKNRHTLIDRVVSLPSVVCDLRFAESKPLKVWLPQQICIHRVPFWMDGDLTVAKLSENGIRALEPACPGEGRIAVHVLRVDSSPGVEKKLNGVFVDEGCGAMQRSLGPGAAVAHESARFDGRLGRAVRIGPVREQNSGNQVLRRASRGQGGM
jgi:hypothetical protein